MAGVYRATADPSLKVQVIPERVIRVPDIVDP